MRTSALGVGVLAAIALAVPAHAATIEVTNTDDSGAGSLRAAIEAANASTDPLDVIDATGVSGTIELQSALPQITGAVEIEGPGSDRLTLRREEGDNYRLLNIDFTGAGDALAYVSVSGIALIGAPGAEQGGGIESRNGVLRLDDVVVSGHRVPSYGGGVAVFSGAVMISDSAIAENLSGFLGGGVSVHEGAQVVLDRVTLSGNQADDVGGGLYVGQAGPAHLVRNSTIVGNTASTPEVPNVGSGGGISLTAFPVPFRIESSTIAGNSAVRGANIETGTTDDLVELRNSVVAYPAAGGDPNSRPENCSVAGTYLSIGHNIVDDLSCGLDDPTDQIGVDPLLGPLADNGGPTLTMAPEPDSPAIDQGTAAGLHVAVDQRGLPRGVDILAIPNPGGGDGTDIGAVELQYPDPEPDTTAPTLKLKKPKVNRKQRSVKLRFNAKDDRSPKAELKLTCRLDRKKFKPCASPVTYKRLRPGKHRITVRAIDAAGNRAQAAKRFRMPGPNRKDRR